MKFDIIFDINDSRSRIEFIVDQYTKLKNLDSGNALLKYAGVTRYEVFWAPKYADEFYQRFGANDMKLSSRTSQDVVIEMNYGISLLEEVNRLRESAMRTRRINQ